MRVVMQLPVQARLEWKAVGGLQGVTIEDTTDKEPTFWVYTSSTEDCEPIIGNTAKVIHEIEQLVEEKKLGAGVVSTLIGVLDGLIRQPIPSTSYTAQQLIEESQEVRARRRDWLIREIENGNYAAITMLKDEFDETVKITVEVV